MIVENCRLSADLYARVGWHPPWIGYLAVRNGVAVGGGAFTGPPRANAVEIAYFTLPQHEGHGIASATAAALVELARKTAPELRLIAHTMDEENASTRILRRLGFRDRGVIQHPEDGPVRAWELPSE